MNKETKNQTPTKKKLILSVAAILAVAALIAGLTYAWFYNHTDMATLMKISPPSNISILGPNGSEMTSLDLNYTAADKDANGKVTVRRVICVQSEDTIVNHYKLEIVHTTNLQGLTFNLYPVSESGAQTVTDGGTTYRYDDSKISGQYLNQNGNTTDYRYANQDQHNTNYRDYRNVQSHAEPLYWLVKTPLEPEKNDQVTIEDKKYNRTYYVCEVTWTEKTKETDIFYILAKTVD